MNRTFIMKRTFLLVLVGLSQQVVFAKEYQNSIFFIRPDLGLQLMTREDYNYESQEAKIGYYLGSAFGFYVFENIFLTGNVIYFPETRIKTQHESFAWETDQEGNQVRKSVLFNTFVSSKQYLLNAGIQYRIILDEKNFINVNGGINYTHVNEKTPGGKELHDASVAGFFGGLQFEKKIDHWPFLLTFEALFSSASRQIRGPGIGPRKSFSLGAGLIYYF